MNIYITKENEDYLRSLSGSMSGYINGLILMDKEDAKLVKTHIVNEGIELNILAPKVASAPDITPQIKPLNVNPKDHTYIPTINFGA